MKYNRRKKYRLKKTTKKLVHLALCLGIMLTITFFVKHILFDKKEPVNASMENTIDTIQNGTKDSSNQEDNNTSDNSSNTDNNNINKNDSAENSNNDITDNSNNNDSGNTDNSNSNDNNDDNDNNNNSNKIDDNQEENQNKHIEKTSLENYAFIGDSITEALAYYKVVNPSNVIANKGYTAKKALADIDKLVSLNPDKVFIMLGLNDILIERNVERYIKNYTALIQEINKNLPNAEIYVQSILPVDASVKNSKLAISNSQIDEFNEGLKKLAMQENIHYLDIASLVKSYNGELREPDGIHYKAKFCNLWLQYIIENV